MQKRWVGVVGEQLHRTPVVGVAAGCQVQRLGSTHHAEHGCIYTRLCLCPCFIVCKARGCVDSTMTLGTHQCSARCWQKNNSGGYTRNNTAKPCVCSVCVCGCREARLKELLASPVRTDPTKLLPAKDDERFVGFAAERAQVGSWLYKCLLQQIFLSSSERTSAFQHPVSVCIDRGIDYLLISPCHLEAMLRRCTIA